MLDNYQNLITTQEDGDSFTDMNGNKIPFRVRKIIGESM